MKVVEEEVEGDRRVPGEMRTALVLGAIATSIFDYIKFTVDTPSNYASGWMPLLASQLTTLLSFEKEISSKYVMNHDETLSTSENELLDTRGDKKTEEHKCKSRLGGVQSTYSDKVVQEDGEVRVPRELQIRGDRIWSDRFRETAGS